MFIQDGKGNGFKAAVNSDNQVVTISTTIAQRLHSAVDNDYFEATTGRFELTTANDTPIIYIENGEDRDVIIDRVFWDIWASTGGTGDGILSYYINPEITGGTDIVPYNTNFGGGQQLLGTFKKSPSTMTGDVWWTGLATPSTSVALEEGRILIPFGATFGISIQPPTGNTSMYVSVNVAMYRFDSKLIQ